MHVVMYILYMVGHTGQASVPDKDLLQSLLLREKHSHHMFTIRSFNALPGIAEVSLNYVFHAQRHLGG